MSRRVRGRDQHFFGKSPVCGGYFPKRIHLNIRASALFLNENTLLLKLGDIIFGSVRSSIFTVLLLADIQGFSAFSTIYYFIRIYTIEI